MQVKPFQAEQFINNIAQNKEIFAAVVYGPESGLVSIRAKKIATAIVADLSDPFLVVNLNESQLENDKGLLADEFAAISMLGGRKLIRIDGGNKITESLKMVFEKLIGDNFILICAGDLEKSSSLRKFAESCPHIATIACYEDDNATIANIIRTKFKELNFTFENEVIEILLNKFGKNRQIILNEIEKLTLFMGEKRHITVEILEENIADIAEISASQLVLAFADRDLKNATLFLQKLFSEKTSAITIIRFLSSYFSKLLLVKSNIQNGSNLDLEMKIQNIFFKSQPAFKKHLNSWNEKQIANILLKLQELEINCKNSNFDPEMLLFRFIDFSILRK